jgi:mitochondrial fission protein ELM1
MNSNDFGIYKNISSIWVVSDGTKGMEVQSLGLAERMGFTPTVIRLKPPSLIRHIPKWGKTGLYPLPDPLAKAAAGGWPDLIITTGRRMAGLSIFLKTKSNNRSKTIHIQDPKLASTFFDHVIVPSHDRLRGDNVILTLGSLSTITPEKISESAKNLPRKIFSLPKPRIAVMVGGSNRRYPVGEAEFTRLGQYLSALAHATDGGLAIIPSRRSHDKAAPIIAAQIGTGMTKKPEFWIWDGTGNNPYPGILDVVDAIVVTADSVNMTCEACGCGKPVYRYDFKEEKGRIGRFHQIMESAGYSKPLEPIDASSFPGTPGPELDETGRIADLLMGRKDPEQGLLG